MKPAPRAAPGGEPDRRDQLLRVGHLAAHRDQRDHQDRHARAQHPREQQPRADAERARLGRRRAVEGERERGPQLPLAGEVDGGARRQPGEQRGDALLERELARGEQVGHARTAGTASSQRTSVMRANSTGRRITAARSSGVGEPPLLEPAAHAPELRLRVAVEGHAADQHVDRDGQQRDVARHDHVVRVRREDDGHVDHEHRRGDGVDEAARQRRAALEPEREPGSVVCTISSMMPQRDLRGTASECDPSHGAERARAAARRRRRRPRSRCRTRSPGAPAPRRARRRR